MPIRTHASSCAPADAFNEASINVPKHMFAQSFAQSFAQ